MERHDYSVSENFHFSHVQYQSSASASKLVVYLYGKPLSKMVIVGKCCKKQNCEAKRQLSKMYAVFIHKMCIFCVISDDSILFSIIILTQALNVEANIKIISSFKRPSVMLKYWFYVHIFLTFVQV